MEKVTIFYHVAAMGHWRSIVAEQLRLIARWDIKAKVLIGFTGSPHEAGFIWRTATSLSVDFSIMFDSSGLDQFEFPTLWYLKKHCDDGLEGNVVYIHTKGASLGGDWHSTMWRWLMNAYVLRDETLELLKDHPWVSTTIHRLSSKVPNYPCGNFWAATSEHIRALLPVHEFRKEFLSKWIEERPPWMTGRIAAEMWLGCATTGVPKALIEPTFYIGQENSFIKQIEHQDFATKNGS